MLSRCSGLLFVAIPPLGSHVAVHRHSKMTAGAVRWHLSKKNEGGSFMGVYISSPFSSLGLSVVSRFVLCWPNVPVSFRIFNPPAAADHKKSKSSQANMSCIARNLAAATSRNVRTTLQRSQNVRSVSSRWAIPATFLTSTDRMISLPSASTGGHHLDSINSRWFSSTSSSVPTYRSMSDSAKSTGDSFSKICFIGAGKMAESMITPIIKDGIMAADRVSIYDVSNKTMDRISKQHEGIQTSTSIPDAISDADLIVMAVKPQNCPTVYDEIRRARELTKDASSGVHLNEGATLLSVIAGKPISSYINGTGLKKIARSMPNTPAQIGRGMTVWSCTGAVDADEKKKIKQVLGSFGKEIFVDDESFIVSCGFDGILFQCYAHGLGDHLFSHNLPIIFSSISTVGYEHEYLWLWTGLYLFTYGSYD